jgi:arylsulfatase A-like enzyme
MLAQLACGRGEAPTGSTPSASGTTRSSAATRASASAAPSSRAVPASSAPAKALHRPAEPLNVLFLTIDSMRADMPWTNYERKIAPTLTAFAHESVIYENAYAVASYTAKSVGTMLSGRYPSSLYRSGSFFTKYSDANLFFPELLQQRGVRTLAGHAHLYFDRGKNLRQGFDVWKLVPGLTWNNSTDESITSPKLTDLAIEMLKQPQNTGGKFFMWLHYMDPHDQYVQHAESPRWGRRNRDRYDSEMFFTDLHIKRLFSYCKAQPWYKRTAVIISSDHGEAFGEHRMYKHAFALWEILTHVPVIIRAPGAQPRRIKARRSHIDLAPTIIDLMGLPPNANFVGKSMVPEVYGATPDNREPIVLDLPADTNNPPTRAIIAGDYKLIVDLVGGGFRLYDLKRDKAELRNLALDKRFRSKFSEMRALYEKTWKKIPQITPFGGNKLVGGKRANGPEGP